MKSDFDVKKLYGELGVQEGTGYQVLTKGLQDTTCLVGDNLVVYWIEEDQQSLAIRRANEGNVFPVVSDLGISPELVKMSAGYGPHPGAWIAYQKFEGTPLTAEIVREEPELIRFVAAAIKKLHTSVEAKKLAMGEAESPFTMSETFSIEGVAKGRLPADFVRAVRIVGRCQQLLVQTTTDWVPAHANLMAHNILFQGGDIRFVGWKCVGMQDARRDLGKVQSQLALDENARRMLVTEYYGEFTTELDRLVLAAAAAETFVEAAWNAAYGDTDKRAAAVEKVLERFFWEVAAVGIS